MKYVGQLNDGDSELKLVIGSSVRLRLTPINQSEIKLEYGQYNMVSMWSVQFLSFPQKVLTASKRMLRGRASLQCQKVTPQNATCESTK